MSGQGRTRSREGEEYDQLDSNIIPQPQGVEEVDEGIDSGLGQATTSAGAVAIPHRPSTSGSDQGVEESQGAVATGGKKKSKGLKHAIQKKIINRIVKPRTSSSGDSQLSPDRVEADPQNILEGESSMGDPAELDERLREEMEEKLRAELRGELEEKVRAELRVEMEEKVKAELREEMEEKVRAELREGMEEKVRAEREKMEEKLRVELREEIKEEKADWTKTAEAKWKDEAKGELQKLRKDLASKFEEKRKSTATQAQSELERVKQNNSTILRLKARELQDKEAAIKSLQEEVEKLKRSEGSFADLTEKNLELKKDIRHKEEMERLQLEKIQDLKKLLEQQNVSLTQQKEQIGQQANRHKAELDTKDRHHQDDLQQAEESLKLIQQLKEKLADMAKKVKELEVEREKVKGQLEDAEKLRGELEKECRDLQIRNGELLMKTKRNEVDEQGQAENEGDVKHENEMKSLQYELELVQSELKQERERGRAKLRELEDKLRAGAVQTGRVTLLEPSDAPAITQYNGQEQMKPDDSAQPPLDIPSNVHQFCLQLSELVDPEGQSLQVPSLPLSTEALKAIGVTPNVKSRGYVVAVFQAYAKAQSVLLDYSRVGEYKGHEGLMAGDDKSPRTSLGEEKSPYSSFGEAKLVGAEDNKSPYSSLGEVKMVVVEDNMTDSDKLELQDMLKQSQEELERLWSHNQLLHERLKVLEGQHHMHELEGEGEIDISKSQCKVAELTNRLRAYQEHVVETEPVKLQRLKKKYLSLHAEKLQIQSEKMKLLGELEERDVQLKELLSESPYGSPRLEQSLSLGALESPEDPRAEVYRLRSVVNDREKKLSNLNIQLKTFQEVAASNADHERQLKQLQMKLKATEAEVQRLKTDSELAGVNRFLNEEVSSVRKQLKTLECEKETIEKDAETKITAERDSNLELESEVARLKSAVKFWESKYPQDVKHTDTTDEELAEMLHQVEVTDLQSKIKRKDSAILNLTDCRCTLESRMARLREERDRYAEQNTELLTMKANLMGELDRYSEEHAVQLKMKLDALKVEKEVMLKEAEDLQNEMKARKLEVELVKQDFEEERKERENMISKQSEKFGKWRVREQELIEQLQHSESRLREQTNQVSVNERIYQEGLKQMDNKLKLRTHESEQRELQLTVKLEQTGKLQQELDAQCDQLRVELDGVRMEWKAEFELRQKQEKEHQEIVQALQQQMNEENALLKEERDIIKAEWNNVANMYEDQKRKYQAELETLQVEYQHRQSHAESQLRGMEEQLQCLQSENQHVKERSITEKLKLQASMKHEFENKLHEITQRFSSEKDALTSKLGALEQQRKHDYAEWMVDRRSLESAIGDTSRLSDEVMTLEQQLKHEKARIRHLEQLSKKKEEEHKEEAEIVRAQYESEKMDQELLMIPLKRELDQLRSQTFGDGQHSDTFRRMEAEGREARNELEILKGKYDGIMDGFTVARDLLIKHNIPLPTCGDKPTIGQPIIVMDETQVSAQPHQDMDPFVRPYVASQSPPQLLPPSGDSRNRSSSNVGAGGFHRLSDVGARKHAFSSTQRGISDRPPLDNYSSDPYGADQQNLVSQKMLNKAGYNKPGGYPEKPVSPNLAAPEHFQAPVLRAQGEGGVIQGHAPYSQQGGGAIHGHAYDQRMQPPVSEAMPYQQPRYPPPQPHLPQGQQAMMNAPQPQQVPYSHGQPQHAPHGHGHAQQPQHAPPVHGNAPQGMPYPPSSPQGRRPPNPSAPQENYLVKGIDADIAEAAAGVRQEVTLESMVPAGEAWPLDSNLICPMCKKQYRIGQIQYYKQHVDKCEGV